MRYAVAASLLLALLSCTASRPQPPVLAPIYAEFSNAIEAGDLTRAEQYISAGRLRSLAEKSEADALAALSVLSPKEAVATVSETIRGDEGTLVLRANVAGNVSTGNVSFAREGGHWRIYSESWDIGSPPESSPMAAPAPAGGDPSAIRALKERGYAMPSADYLVMAAGTGDLEAVKLFVKAGYAVDSKANGTPAIVNAATSHRSDVVIYLISAGANVNAVDDVNTTALMRAAEHCEMTEAIRALLRAGARIDVRAAGGATALQLADYANCEANAQLIRAAARE